MDIANRGIHHYGVMKYRLCGVAAGVCLSVLPCLHETAVASTVPQIAQQDQFTQPNFAQHFQDLGVEGSILIYDLKQDRTYQHNPERNATPFLPASTFKILNTLIALETGAIANELSILTWDGIERSIPEWNRDLNMQTAFKVSAVWFYQVLARRIGYEQMQQWITKVGYGNQTIGPTEEIDTFWLNGQLRITPQEQIQLLRRLHQHELPFSEDAVVSDRPSAIASLKNIMIVEQTPDYTIRAKTGWAASAQTGWYVGYLEQHNNVYFFATNINIRDERDLKARQEITRRSLKTLNLKALK